MITDVDLTHLRRCVALAASALDAGDEPFGSVLVGGDGTVLAEEQNHAITGDETRHPEFELARWAGGNLNARQRRTATVYTSGEHCPMCSAAHAWVGLGRVVYAVSAKQLSGWLGEWGIEPAAVLPLRIQDVAPGIAVDGPAPELVEEMHRLHARRHGRSVWPSHKRLPS
jgi:tRNA(Arg) A34 adenosine deaminase TadA